jgi:hypothetical protein
MQKKPKTEVLTALLASQHSRQATHVAGRHACMVSRMLSVYEINLCIELRVRVKTDRQFYKLLPCFARRDCRNFGVMIIPC